MKIDLTDDIKQLLKSWLENYVYYCEEGYRWEGVKEQPKMSFEGFIKWFSKK